jgi:hypothetical protein
LENKGRGCFFPDSLVKSYFKVFIAKYRYYKQIITHEEVITCKMAMDYHRLKRSRLFEELVLLVEMNELQKGELLVQSAQHLGLALA